MTATAPSRPGPSRKEATPARGKRTSAREDPGTRQKVIDAAIRCILEQGFYRASSNAIADTAGLSWGVIQYYFGSRESLMLAVLDEASQRYLDILSNANLTGETLSERLEQYFDILERNYGQPEYLAITQVLLNLSHDPRTSQQTLESMTESGAAIEKQIHRLTNQLFAGIRVRRQALRTFAFNALRGLALSEVMLGTVPGGAKAKQMKISDQKRMLADAVAWLIEREQAR